MNEIFEKIKKLRVLVIGDIMLDRTFFTDVSRISPEAPVPVARFEKESLTMGGAANVALNLANLGVKTYLLGRVGVDQQGAILRKLISDSNIELLPIISAKQRTITKTRIVARGNHLLRLDYEDIGENAKQNQKEVIIEVKRALKNVDLVIVSDYQKGMIDKELIEYLKTLDKYIAIDTKPGSFKDFKGFSLLKPNFKEAVGIARNLGNTEDFKNTDEDLNKLGSFLKYKLGTNILITRGDQGATYISDKVYHNKIKTSEVLDVTGAGDTCIAVFSVLDYLKYDKGKALEIMNVAAKIAVSHIGTHATTFEEIEEEYYRMNSDVIYRQKDAKKIAKMLKKQGKKIVFTNGCFDILHKGHVSYLKKAKKLGDVLIVGLNSDSSIRKLKGKSRPIIDENSRYFVLSHLECVDYVILFEDETPAELIKVIEPNVLVKGADYKGKEVVGQSFVISNGGKVVLIELEDGHSTTKIVEKIKNGRD